MLGPGLRLRPFRWGKLDGRAGRLLDTVHPQSGGDKGCSSAHFLLFIQPGNQPMCQDMEQFKHLIHKCENQSSDSQELTLIEGWYNNLPVIPA